MPAPGTGAAVESTPVVSRRHFVGAAAAMLVAAGLPLPAGVLFAGEAAAAPARPGPGGSSTVPGDVFASSANFAPCLHTVFRVKVGPRVTDLVLTEVKDLPVPRTRAGRRPDARFSLLFDGSSAPAFAQGTYPVRHPKLGGFDLFLVPVGMSGSDYQAIVNRVHA